VEVVGRLPVLGHDGRELLELRVEVAKGGDAISPRLELAKIHNVGGPRRGRAAGSLYFFVEGGGDSVEGA
jgi:hypothetical protein